MPEFDRSQLNKIPEFDTLDIQALDIQRLGGLTNQVYRIADDSHTWLLRVAGEGTDEYIDRSVEEHNARVAADVGVSASVYYFDRKTGLMLANYLDGCETMSASKFNERAGAPARAGRVMKKLHSSGQRFQFRFELFSMIDEYLKTLESLDVELPRGYHDVVKEAEPIQNALEKQSIVLAPCHCDPLAENFLDDGKRMWMVDWEYSGMNDPLWDLGDLSVEAGFTDEQDLEMLNAYFDGNLSPSDHGRMVIYKAMADLLWTLWGLIQHGNKNPADDFWAYATGRFERCQRLMAKESFARHLAAIG